MAISTQIEILQRALNCTDVGLVLIDAQCRILVTNELLGGLLKIQPQLLRAGADFADLVRSCHQRGDYGGVGDAPGIEALIAELTSGADFTRTLARPSIGHLEVRRSPLGLDAHAFSYRNAANLPAATIGGRDGERLLHEFAEAGSD